MEKSKILPLDIGVEKLQHADLQRKMFLWVKDKNKNPEIIKLNVDSKIRLQLKTINGCI